MRLDERLDEWRKYLNAQFVDEEELQAHPAKEAAATPAAGTASIPKESVLPLSLFSEQTVPTVTSALEPPQIESSHNTEHKWENPSRSAGKVNTLPEQTASLTMEERSLLEAPLSPSELEQSRAPLSPTEETIADSSVGSRPTAAASYHAVTSAFVPISTPESMIPTFDQYLSSAHTAANARKEEATPEAHPPLVESNTVPGPSSVLMPMTTFLVTARPNRRARHARNVIPEKVSPGLSAAELWAEVPRHVQTLLALGRMEDEKETAQSSYKRPFQEKRIELIARLLDPILTLEEAARLLNVCPTTVRRYTNKGILNHYRKEPDKDPDPQGNAHLSDKETRQRRFRLSDILTFLEAQQTALEEDKQKQPIRRMRKTRTEPSDSRAEQIQPSGTAATSEAHLAS